MRLFFFSIFYFICGLYVVLPSIPLSTPAVFWDTSKHVSPTAPSNTIKARISLNVRPSTDWNSHAMVSDSTFPFTVTEHVIDTQYIREYPRATVSQDASLSLVVKKYTPLNNPSPSPGDVTIIGAHGCGFPKVKHRLLPARYM